MQQTLWRALLSFLQCCVKNIRVTGAGGTCEGQPEAIAPGIHTNSHLGWHAAFTKLPAGNQPSKHSTMGKGDPFQLPRQWGGHFACDGRPCRNADPLGPGKLLYESYICVFFFSYTSCRVSHLVFKISLSYASMWEGFSRDHRHLVSTVLQTY